MIERATVEHVRMLAEVGASVLKDLPNYSGVPFDVDHTASILSMYLTNSAVGCFFKQVDGEVVALFMGVVAAPWFTTQKEMAEIIFWVRKDYRKTNTAIEMLRHMEQWAKSEGAVKLLMAAGSGYETDRVMKFYNWMGYRTCGASACKEI